MWLTCCCYKYIIQVYAIDVYCISFIFTFFISLFISVFVYFFFFSFFFGGGGTGVFFIFLSGGALPPKENTSFVKFYQNGGDPSVCSEHVHTGRPHTRIDYSIFKKPNVMSFQWKKNKNLKLEFRFSIFSTLLTKVSDV